MPYEIAPSPLVDANPHSGVHKWGWDIRYRLPWIGAIIISIPAGVVLAFEFIELVMGDGDSLAIVRLLLFGLGLFGFPMLITHLSELHRRVPLRRDLAEIRARDFFVCLHCRYDLSRTPDATTCPECGRPFNPATARASWLWTYRDALSPRDRHAKPWLDAPQPGAPHPRASTAAE